VTWVAPRHVIAAVLVACALTVLGIAWPTYHPPVKRQWEWLYSSEKWDVVKANAARRGFAPDSIHVVTATTLSNGGRFAIIGGRTEAGRPCLAVARGVSIGTAICRISKPVMIFSAPDLCAPCSPGKPPTKVVSVLGLIRSDVTVNVVDHGREGGLGAVPADIGFVFNSNFARANVRFRARDASGRVLSDFSAHR
jgi:hypothetical protein